MSTRAKCRQAEREKRKPRVTLTATEASKLNQQRTLPPDHPSAHKDFYIPTHPELGRLSIDLIDRSGVLAPLERALRSHPGVPSQLPLRALLAVMVITAFASRSYRRTDLCAVLNGLEAGIAWKLGLCSTKARTLFSYNIIDKQCLRLERALMEGWIDDEDGTACDLDWLSHCLLQTNITPEQAERITAIAVDSTFVLAHATPSGYPEGEDPPSGPRSADPHAKFGHHSATGKQTAGIRLGYDVHTVTPTRSSARWAGDPKRANLSNESEPPVILALKVVPASTSVAPTMLKCIEQTKQIAPNVNEVIADRGYTMKTKNFIRPLHKDGMKVVLDLEVTQIDKVRKFMFGINQHPLIEHCGTFLPAWLDPKLHKPPQHLKSKQRRKWYDQRAKFRYSPDQFFKDGSIRFQCPQCAGRIRSNKKTRNTKVKAAKDALFVFRSDDAEYCCSGRVTVPVKYLDRYQTIPYGTTAHKQTYSRRNPVENGNSILKDKGGLDHGSCRALDLAPRFIATLMQAVANEIRIARHEQLNDHPDPDNNSNTETETDQYEADDQGNQTHRSRDGPD